MVDNRASIYEVIVSDKNVYHNDHTIFNFHHLNYYKE